MLFNRSILPGGIRVVTERMPEVRSASLGFWVGVGSRDEEPELQGSSHLLEHVLFKGTESRSSRDISEAFDAVGGEVNAFSAKEYTCVYGRVLSDDLPMAIEILTDMLCNASLRPSDVESERKVVLEEIAMRDDYPEDMVHDVFAGALMGDHPLAREVMGTSESVSAISPEALNSFYREHYHPSNIVVSAAGDVEHAMLASFVEEAFSKGGRSPAQRTLSVPAPVRALRVVARQSEQAHVVIGGLGISRHHPDRFVLGVLDDLLGGGTSSRLFQEIREERGLAYSVYSYRHHFIETGVWGVYAGTSPARAPVVVELICAELDRLAGGDATEKELERAKGRSRGALVLSLEDPASRMSRLGRSEMVHGEILSIDDLIARVDAVTLDDVSRVAGDLFRPENRVLVVMGPVSEDDFGEW